MRSTRASDPNSKPSRAAFAPGAIMTERVYIGLARARQRAGDYLKKSNW
jgi:hypothetical protein